VGDLLQAALDPKSIAIVGASDNPHKIGGRPILYMKRHGFRGAIYPINPHRAEVQGLASYASLASLPQVPELALVIVGGAEALAAVEACAALGVKAAIVIASGFAESGAEGRAIQDRMAAAARAAGMRLVGPNTQGLANFGSGAVASFSTLFSEVEPQDGPVAVVSQSGGVAAVVYGLLRGRGIGVRHVHATGNEADVTLAALAWAVAHDPQVKLLLLYCESLRDAQLLAETARHARERGLPIVAVKAGRTAGGRKAAASHTGSLANEDRVVDAFLRHHGIWRASDPRELTLAAEMYLKGWRPEGRRLLVISNSGASCVMAADRAEELGLTLAELSADTRAEVAAKLPGFATAANPIDVTAALLQDSGLLGGVLGVVAKDPAVDLCLVAIPVTGASYDVAQFARDAAGFAAATGKPLAVSAWQAPFAAPFRAAGLPVYDDETDALGALAQLAGHTALLARRRAPWPPGREVEVPHGASVFLDEAQSLALLGRHGLPVVAHRMCASAAEARAAFEALGAPVVVKACSVDIPHKSEHGLVAVGVRSAEEAARIFEAQWKKMGEMGAARGGVIVAAMRGGLRELMIGARVDPDFGPVVVVGDGGKYVESLRDFALLVTPFDEEEVKEALRGLRIAPLLAGVRGDPPLDLDAFAAAAVGVGRIIQAARGAIASIDANPVMAGAVGEGVVIVDALIERGRAP
jgi:acyl-CoA synthetase (NDP forming)